MLIQPIEIAPFSEDHAPRVFDLLQDVSKFHVNCTEISEIVCKFLSTEESHALVAVHNGVVVGFGSIIFYTRVRGGTAALLEDIVVDRGFRGRQIGARLIDALLNCARRRGCYKVSLEAASSAYPFYRKIGFKDGGMSMKVFLENEGEIGGC